MTDTLKMVHEEAGGRGGFYLRDVDGRTLGSITYYHDQPGTVVFDHTDVDESLRGQGRARQLLDAGVEWVRAEHLHITPECPYVKGQFRKDPSLADVLTPGASIEE